MLTFDPYLCPLRLSAYPPVITPPCLYPIPEPLNSPRNPLPPVPRHLPITQSDEFYTEIRFPATRRVLWDRRPLAPAVRLDPGMFVPLLWLHRRAIRGLALRAQAHQITNGEGNMRSHSARRGGGGGGGRNDYRNDNGNNNGGSPSPMALLVGGPIVVPRDSRAASRVAHLNPGRGETHVYHILLDAVAPADYGGGSGGGSSLSRTRRHVPRGGVQAEMWTSLSPRALSSSSSSSSSSSPSSSVERTVERKEQGGVKGSAAAGPWAGDVYVEKCIQCCGLHVWLTHIRICTLRHETFFTLRPDTSTLYLDVDFDISGRRAH